MFDTFKEVNRFRKYGLVLVTLLSLTGYGQRWEFNTGFGQLVPHRSTMNHMIEGPAIGFEASHIWDTWGTKAYHEPYNNPSFGICANFFRSGSQTIIGNIYGTYGFVNFPVGKEKQLFNFRVGLGIGYVDKTFDPNTNNRNVAIGSHLNANVVFRADKKIGDNIIVGVGATHFSNGSYQTPNLGLNFFTARLGFDLPLGRISCRLPAYDYNFDNVKLDSTWHFSVSALAGVKENRNPFGGKYPIFNITANAFKQYHQKYEVIGSADIIYNPSILQAGDSTSHYSPMQAGLALGNNFRMDRFLLSVSMGAYLFTDYKDNGKFYHKITAEYYLTDKLRATFLLKSHWAVAEYFLFGIGYTIR